MRDVRKELLFFYVETSNFKLAQKCSFHAIEELSLAKMQTFEFLALKDRLTIIRRLLCLVTQIILLTFLTGSK